MIKPLLVAAAFLAGCQTIGDAHAARSGTSNTERVSSAEINTVTVRTATPEDYYVPLDNWLKAKGSPLSGRDFYEVGKQYGIDPDVLIAITKAETQLCSVKQRGSRFNCGSVGSFDSTATTYDATSYRHGIEQIAQTLDNPLLGKHVAIAQLSRAGNPSGPVYATSPANWQRNVLATLSELKGRPVGPEYGFRR